MEVTCTHGLPIMQCFQQCSYACCPQAIKIIDEMNQQAKKASDTDEVNKLKAPAKTEA